MNITVIRVTPSTLSSFPSLPYWYYFYSLLTSPANALPPKYCFTNTVTTFLLISNSGHRGLVIYPMSGNNAKLKADFADLRKNILLRKLSPK